MNWFVAALIATCFFGTYNFLYGFLNKSVSIGTILVGIGTGIVLLGIILGIAVKKYSFTFSANWWLTPVIGLVLGLGIFFVVRALSDPNAKIAQLVPILNTNTLISVALGLIILKEYQSVSVVRIVLGAILIVLGTAIIR